MKNFKKLIALSLSSLFALSMFVACGDTTDDSNVPDKPSVDDPITPDDPNNKPDDPNNKPDNPVEPAGTPISARICYDNLPDDGISISESDTKAEIKGAEKIYATDWSGEFLDDYTEIATYEDGVFTAVSSGVVHFEIAKQMCRLEVVPAYATDPKNQYGSSDDTTEDSSKLLGGTHDPSLIEVEEEGSTAYYMFSTGWASQSSYDGKRTYGNAIHRSLDGMRTWEFVGRTFDYSTRQMDFVNTEVGQWLYGGACNGYGEAQASWWAPDVVPAPNGGYWLYTCVVDGAGDDQGMQYSDGKYARACSMLYYSDSLEQGSFEYVGVLMQSSIRRGESVRDVNAIDPQIIYDTEGNMYMAYGSFGSGNYVIELDPQTGLRKDGKGWQTHETIRGYIENDIQTLYNTTENSDADGKSIGWEHEYYGKNISKLNMEAPVLARHDGVKIADETAQYDENGEPVGVEGKTYYYSMHSYNGLLDDYQMWGGRSESVLGIYKSVNGGIVYNAASGYPARPSSQTEGNKYMGAFQWSNKSASNKEIDVVLTGHNDLFTTNAGVNIAAYITRTTSFGDVNFVVQTHQYYLNSMGDLCINPNRYALEIDRSVSAEELFAYTNNGKFQMVQLANQRDTGNDFTFKNIITKSVEVQLTEDGNIKDAGGSKIGSWIMYGKGYIKISFDSVQSNGEQVYYGVVRPAWLYEQGTKGKSGFTITCMGHSQNTRSMAMFLNAQSNMTGDGFVGK